MVPARMFFLTSTLVVAAAALANNSFEEEWKGKLVAEHQVSRSTLAQVESKGCG